MTSRIGLIGCGSIADIYLTNEPLFGDIAGLAYGDLNPEAARRLARRYGIEARAVDSLLASGDSDIILNLTIFDAHADVSLAALAAGKHVYSEKPLATALEDGMAIVRSARDKGLRVGVAPDTVLWPSVQEARRLIDAGAIGKPIMGAATMLSHGWGHWHPNPAFFYRIGAGPVSDMGPYYLTALVTLLGSVAAVMATGQIAFDERTVTTPGSPQFGQAIKVETLTTVQALLEFRSGAQGTFLTSWDVRLHGMPPIELHGSLGSIRLPDPNVSGGEMANAEGRGDWRTVPTGSQRFGRPNVPPERPRDADCRGLGLADMAGAIVNERAHRANGDLALHVLATMNGILVSARDGLRLWVAQACDRPAPLVEFN